MIKGSFPENFRSEELARLSSLATSNPELFRHEASQAAKAFSLEQRRWTNELENGTYSAVDFYHTYEVQFRPLIEELNKLTARPVFVRTLRTSLGLGEVTAEALGTRLLDERKNQAIDEFIEGLKGKARWRAARILTMPTSEVDRCRATFETYALYLHVAKISNTIFVDVHAGTIPRLIQRFKAWRQRRTVTKNKALHLKKLQTKLREFEQAEGDLPGLIVEHGLDLMLVLGARQDYEKARKETVKDSLGTVRQFDISTKKLVENHMADYIRHYPKASVQQLNQEEASIKALLLRIFELDTTARNRLVVTISECRSLYEEIRRAAL